jgi:hypothetical protein
MACYAYNVLTSWFSSVYCRAGSETAWSQQSKQVVIASSMTPMDVNDISSRPETTDDVPESCQEPIRKGGDTAKVIIIPTETANYIMGHAHSAFVSTRTKSDMEDPLICDGGATYTCTLTKTLENCTQCKPKCRNSHCARCDNHAYNTPLSYDVLRSRLVGRNSSNCCQSICCSRTEI